MLIALFFVVIGFYLIRKSLVKKEKPVQPANKYIVIHEQKIKDDSEYQDYFEWCKMKGEIAVEKEGYDEHRMKEYMMYKKLMKYGISGSGK
ncbi:hypothetical protein CLU96_1238 [Chryseobacterium sp. 52]|uniref:hypothetical protein n=1 Tax=Chryseobacterium sp. 52 TaxID=2035213 RepID=UPI000C1A15DC|nr:hypothetical protein [Chryseobacterium sp. 52]PIF44297.1 hypothetical protein CLU96_1238 [Chryseobacterium sp. 52]